MISNPRSKREFLTCVVVFDISKVRQNEYKSIPTEPNSSKGSGNEKPTVETVGFGQNEHLCN